MRRVYRPVMANFQGHVLEPTHGLMGLNMLDNLLMALEMVKGHILWLTDDNMWVSGEMIEEMVKVFFITPMDRLGNKVFGEMVSLFKLKLRKSHPLG